MADLLRVKGEIKDKKGQSLIYDQDLATQASIIPDIEKLNLALATNPGRFAEWAMLEAMARAEWDAAVGKVNDLGTELKDVEAALQIEFVGQGTVSFLAAKVQIDPRRQAKATEIREAEGVVRQKKDQLETMIVGRKTLEQKRDSLLALASNWRQEMQTGLGVRGNPGDADRYRPGSRTQGR